MQGFRFPVLTVSVLLFACSLQVRADNELGLRQRLKEMDTQLKAARESVHRAQVEMAKKAERIEELEGELKRMPRSAGDSSESELRREIADLRKKNAKLSKQLTERKKKAEMPSKKVAKKPKKDTSKSRESITISYDKNSAANYEGREMVLRWIEAHMESGAKKFSIMGGANDSVHRDANVVIANNRAKFLADFLIMKGVPEESLSVSGKFSDAEDEKGRFVVVASDR